MQDAPGSIATSILRKEMKSEDVSFYSDGYALHGAFFSPHDDLGLTPKPLIVIASGFTGLYRLHPTMFAEYLTKNGHRCFSFDFRGFADSQGHEGDLLLEDQVRDVRNAVSFARSFDWVQSDEIALVGWGMGAGVVLEAAYGLPGIRAICAVNGFYNGRRFLTSRHGLEGMATMEGRIEDARQTAATSGEWPRVAAFDIYRLDRTSSTYVDKHLKKHSDYRVSDFSFGFADSLLRWVPESRAPLMTTPIWIAHGEENTLHSPEEASSLYRSYAGEKELYWIRKAGHTEWMIRSTPTYFRFIKNMEHWLREILS